MPASVGFMSFELTSEHQLAQHRASFLIHHDAAWSRWREAASVGAWYLYVEDREKTFRRLAREELTYAVGVERILRADQEGRLVAEWLSILGEMADYWATKQGTVAPPPLPDPATTLPPAIESSLVELAASLVVSEAESEWIAELVEEDEDPSS